MWMSREIPDHDITPFPSSWGMNHKRGTISRMYDRVQLPKLLLQPCFYEQCFEFNLQIYSLHLYFFIPVYLQMYQRNLFLHQAFCVWLISQICVEGAGVNLILDCIGGSYWEKNVKCLALDGRWVLYGLMGGADVSGPLFSKLLFKRGSLITSLLRSRDKKVSIEWKENMWFIIQKSLIHSHNFEKLKIIS